MRGPHLLFAHALILSACSTFAGPRADAPPPATMALPSPFVAYPALRTGTAVAGAGDYACLLQGLIGDRP